MRLSKIIGEGAAGARAEGCPKSKAHCLPGRSCWPSGQRRHCKQISRHSSEVCISDLGVTLLSEYNPVTDLHMCSQDDYDEMVIHLGYNNDDG